MTFDSGDQGGSVRYAARGWRVEPHDTGTSFAFGHSRYRTDRMPIRKHAKTSRAQNVKSAASIAAVRQHADALFRAAQECCRQHDRFARLLARPLVDVEELAIEGMCKACDETLAELAKAYEAAAGSARPGTELPWWHKANALWIASREYVRRHAGCDAVTRRLGQHAPGDLAKLHTEFELEASALLALRHACDAYQGTCPDAA